MIGRGSNVLAPDEGFDGALLALGDGFKTIEKSTDLSADKVLVRAGAGLSLTRVADWCAARGLAGLEFAAGIPGCVGAAVLKNAGAWGSEMGAVVASVTVMNGREERTLPRSCLHFSYRSLWMAPALPAPLIVAAVEFELRRSSTVAIREQMAYYHQLRREKQPLNQPSAGSFFKNPPGLFAAELIESSGLKGLRVGDAQVSTRHANFFVNRGRATARQMIALMREVQQKVEKQHGVCWTRGGSVVKIIRTLFIKLGFLPRKKALSGGIDAGRSRFSSPPNQPKSTNKTVLRKINEWWLTRKPAKKSAQIEIKRGIFSPRTLWLLWLGTAGMVGFWLFSSIDGSSLVQRALAHIDLFKIVVVSVEGETHSDAEQIRASSGIMVSESMFSVSSEDVEYAVTSANPWIADVEIIQALARRDHHRGG